ncbi:MAG: TolC family protein [Verrucomicrobia bacterium]|nr:TolC family protein [Verrucomicrobiota bacterium]
MRLKTLCGLSLCVSALAAYGQTNATTPKTVSLSMKECVQLALLHNRDLQIQRFNPAIARLTLNGSYSYYEPTFSGNVQHSHRVSGAGYNSSLGLTLTGTDVQSYDTTMDLSGSMDLSGKLPMGMSYDLNTSYDNTWGFAQGGPVRSYSPSMGASLTQHLLRDFWTDQGRTTIEVSKRDLKKTELGVDYTVMDVLTKVQTAYYELIYARDNVKVEEKLLEVRERFYRETKRKVEVGTLPPLEEKLAQSQVAKVKADLILARNTVALDENTLKSLLGDDFVSSVGTTLAPSDSLVVVPETFELAESWRRGLAQRPDLTQLKLDVERADLDLKYRHNQLFPSLDLKAGIGMRGNDPSSAGAFGQMRSLSNPNDLLEVIFSVPLTRTAERANYRASKLKRAQANVLVKQLEEAILKSIDDAVKNVRTKLESITATREATVYAQAALEAEEKKLVAGKSTAYVVLQLQSDLATAAAAEIRAKADYNIALAQLYFVEGSALERNKIAIEIK